MNDDEVRTLLRKEAEYAPSPQAGYAKVMKRTRRQRRTVATIASVMTLILGATLVIAAAQFVTGDRPQPASQEVPAGHYILLPETAPEGPGAVTLVADTNLPEGTKVIINVSGKKPRTVDGLTCCPEVEDGHVEIEIGGRACKSNLLAEGRRRSTRWEVTLEVRPVFDNLFRSCPIPSDDKDGCGPQEQAPRILEILGKEFDRLEGDQVTEDGNVRRIFVSRTYDHIDRCDPA